MSASVNSGQSSEAAMETSGFIHLRVHSAYSLLEGAITVKALPKLCVGHGMPAVALADIGNLFGALEFSEIAVGSGVQPIIGCQLDLDYAGPGAPAAAQLAPEAAGASRSKEIPPAPIVLYAQNEAGYLNLMSLVSRAFLDSGEAEPKVSWGLLETHLEGLICLTGGPNGPAGRLLQAGNRVGAEAVIERLAELFPRRLYVELHRHGQVVIDDDGEESGAIWTDPEAATEDSFLEIAYARDLPIVAVNEVYFATPDLFEAHDAMLCIADSRYVAESDRRQLTPEHYFKSPNEMRERFADLPEAIDNTVEVALRCAYRPRTRPPILPKFADDEVAELRRQSHEGLEWRLTQIEPSAPRETYVERLDFELGVIERMGFPGYFLIVADFIKWAKDQDIPVGPGRGSGAGSLVAYALTITNLDPLRYQLLFERFLNPERVSMPDFDIDFCQDRREEVIRYVQERYGHEKVAQIITFGALLSKAAVRDVGRVLQLPYGQVDRLSKLIPVEGVKPVSVSKARKDEPRFAEIEKDEPIVTELLNIAEQIEGLYRNASTHAAGVVIGDRPLEQLVPLYRDPRSDMPVTQFNMKWVEPAGLVKFDFLGLKTLTVIQNALDFLKVRGVDIDIDAIPIDDKKTYDLYSRADTVAVFQVESSGMRDALRQLQPTCIEDIIALVALYRPGPMENIPKYCNVKHAREPLESLHPMIDGILAETQGIIVYQEQVMQIAQVMANYSLGGADLLRRAMGKKIKEAMDAERPKFVKGSKENGVDEKKAIEVFDLLEKFANYGFNKSHAAAYGYVSYQTGYLKANYPVEFMAAVMNLDMHLTEKLSAYAQELGRMGVELLPPDVNASGDAFTVEYREIETADAENKDAEEGDKPQHDGQIRYALGALKNVGREAMKLIVDEREANGPFKSLLDFAERVELKAVGKRAMEMLARSGGFDQLEGNRQRVFQSVETLVAYSATTRAERASNQVSLFGGEGVAAPPPRLSSSIDWAPTEKLSEEAAAVGFYLSGHPLDDYAGALKRKRVLSFNDIAAMAGSKFTGRVAGMVLSRQERKSQKGTKFAFVQLSDPTAMFEAVVFSDTLLASRDLLEPGCGVVLSVDAEKEGDQVKLRIQGVEPLDEAVAGAATSGLRVFLEGADGVQLVRSGLETAAEGRPSFEIPRDSRPPRGFGPVSVIICPQDEGWEAEMALPGFHPVSPQVKGALKALPGVRHVEEF